MKRHKITKLIDNVGYTRVCVYRRVFLKDNFTRKFYDIAGFLHPRRRFYNLKRNTSDAWKHTFRYKYSGFKWLNDEIC